MVTLVADWSDRSPELGEFLEDLGSQQLPVIAFFPAENPNQPLVIATGLYTQSQVLANLDKAGPSKATASKSGNSGSLAAAKKNENTN